MDDVARADLVEDLLRIVAVEGILHRIEVIQVAEELVEAVNGWQKLVEVAKVILAELARGIAHRLERRGDRRRLRRQSDVRARLAHGRHPGSDGELTGDEVGAAGRAARLGVVVGEQHPLGGESIEVRRPTGHDPAVVGADVEPTHVVRHDGDDVRLPRRRVLLGSRRRRGAGWAVQGQQIALVHTGGTSRLRRLCDRNGACRIGRAGRSLEPATARCGDVPHEGTTVIIKSAEIRLRFMTHGLPIQVAKAFR